MSQVHAGAPLVKQAIETCKSEANKYWVQRSGDWFTGQNGTFTGLNAATFTGQSIVQVREVTFKGHLDPGGLSEADKLNGLDWRGWVHADGPASRRYDVTGKAWAPWKAGVNVISCRLEHQNGKWTFDIIQHMGGGVDLKTYFRPSEIP